eukprot:1390660-Alexandrium_andersonii.AAC.1
MARSCQAASVSPTGCSAFTAGAAPAGQGWLGDMAAAYGRLLQALTRSAGARLRVSTSTGRGAA